MAYEIHLRKTRHDAGRTNPVLSLDAWEHAALFCQHKDILAEFLSVSGMSNYYGDAVYLEDEIEGLKAELEEMGELLSNEKSAHSVIVKIHGVVETAALENMNVYCFGG